MIGLWEFSAIAGATYFLWNSSPIPLIVQMTCFTLASITIFGQSLIYDRKKSLTYALAASTVNLAFACLIGAIYYILLDEGDKAGYDWVPLLLGGIIIGIALAAGFVPQYYIIFTEKSTRGVSIHFSLLDIFGSACSVVAIFLDHVDWIGISVFFVIIFFQLGFVFLTLFVYPENGSKSEELTNNDAIELEPTSTDARLSGSSSGNIV